MGLTIINYDYYMGYNGIIVNYNGIYKWDELSLAYHWIIWDLVSKWILICFFFLWAIDSVTPMAHLREMIEMILGDIYPKWELLAGGSCTSCPDDDL
jgi:hypothetical protein